ncbi:MAG: endopeptidase La [Polyangiaceae bacterium]
MTRTFPETPFPLLPLRSGVLLPEGSMTLTVGRERSVALIQSLRQGQLLGIVTQRDPKVEDPVVADFHAVGTIAKLTQVLRGPGQDAMRVTVEGLSRFVVDGITTYEPYLRIDAHPVSDERADSPEAKILAGEVVNLLKEGAYSTQLEEAFRLADKPARFADKVAAVLGLDANKTLELLVTLDVPERLKKLATFVQEERQLNELRQKIGDDVRKEIGKNQREHILREQLKAIKKELGEEKGGDDVSRLRDKLDAAGLTEEARQVADRELERLEQTGGQGAEAGVIRTYLEWIASLPWSARAGVKEDIDPIAKKLDEDHTGLDDVKRRILEHMAVRKLAKTEKGTILCLVGPPGVGKTSLGQSIADATDRPFVRLSLGGVRDEAEIRGHRRTYVGALPGRILHGLRKAKVKNPVLLLDEIDKLSNMWGGSAESSLLEVLDPEQNRNFTDHYLEIPFDLSEVLFLCTANTLDTLSAPLRDRLEIVEISGYTPPEKLAIAKKHLIPKRLKDAGIPSGALSVADNAISTIVTSYTREAGVRQLDREISRIARHVALEVARSASKADDTPVSIKVEENDVARILGKPKFRSDVAERTSIPGVATGLAWTPVGGDILFIETSRTKGKGRLEITGQLGDVMKESARAALTYVKSHADELGFAAELLEDSDLHVHVPAGAVPKDGPSAGVTIFTALASLLSGRRVRFDTAMTGECTLRGRVLPVGGIKSKVLAAHRAGIKRVILPRDNERDIDDVPADVRAELEFVLADDMRDVLAAALETLPHMPAGSGGDSQSTTTLHG